MNETCKACILRKNLDKYPSGCPEEAVQQYRDRVRAIAEQGNPASTGPEAALELSQLRREMFGEKNRDFTEIKRHYNALMLRLEETLERQILAASDPLERAVQYAMAGNYIDFAALENVEEGKLLELLEQASRIAVSRTCLESLRSRIAAAETLTYFTDNCGEIVADKLLIRQLQALRPGLEVTVVLRGETDGNDATVEDAEQVGLTELGACMGNGTVLDGSVLRIMPRQVREHADADVVIAKGQANYETLHGCARNVFYIFLCKCELYMRRFDVPQFTGVLTEEEPEMLLREFADRALSERFRFRPIRREEAVQTGEMEEICFPPREACSMESMVQRVERIPEQFLVAEDRETGRLAGFINGLASEEIQFRDAFFTDASLHDPAAQTVYLLGLEVLPQYRGLGLAEELMRLYTIWEQVKGRTRLVLTCHTQLADMYRRFGFRDIGPSASAWGGETWQEMEIYVGG